MSSADVALPSVLREFDNISTVQSRVKSAKIPALPQRYVFPASVVGSIDGSSNFSLPIIDLAGLTSRDPTAKEAIVRQLGTAASEWGFFQIVNHGLPEETMKALYDQARDFFELPVEVKERGEDPRDIPHGYEGRMSHKPEKTPWIEYLAQRYRPESEVEVLADKVWPGGNPTFCNNIHEYCKSTEILGRQLMELLAESLGLQTNVYSKHFQDPQVYQSSWRLHRYPACPDPSRAMGTPAHSDTSVLTILTQDKVGGLQVRKGDRFIDIAPVPGALVINVGDILEAWSNGRFQSAEHRVVVNEKYDRISMVYLFYGAKDLVIECPAELVDDGHASRYVPFTVSEIISYRNKRKKLMKCGEPDTSRVRQTLSFALRPGDNSGIII